jgi:magnesium-transporting ATPase (P-type)
MITGRAELLVADPSISCSMPTASPNMLFAGYKCVAGSCVGVVVAIGDDTVLTGLVRTGKFPPVFVASRLNADGIELDDMNKPLEYSQV